MLYNEAFKEKREKKLLKKAPNVVTFESNYIRNRYMHQELNNHLVAIAKGKAAFQKLAEAAAAGEDVNATVQKFYTGKEAAKREALRKAGQLHRGLNTTAPSQAKQRKAKRRAQGRARRNG